ncbi:MAG: pyridoxine 5'-phosphate synthase [Deltaproteobacteria bacterium]|nr:pyridoxine 5'-phosphate synthase [Deltaproteobacteria bacterium]
MARLSVNVDHVATIRQARLSDEPDPVQAALRAEVAGANSITVHLREDRRHIQDRDLAILRRTIKTDLNLEMAATPEMLKIAMEIKPDLVTLVPEKRQELTTEGGLDLKTNSEELKGFISELRGSELPVNLFIDPNADAIKMSHKLGATGVELHSGTYAEAKSIAEKRVEVKRIQDCAILASRLKLSVHAGHGLDYRNIAPIAAMREIEEFAIGFSIIARSVYTGIEEAVREMKRLIG